MLQTNVRVTTNRDTAGAVDRGVRDALFDAADHGFDVSQQHVPHGATSGLATSGFEPREAADGSVTWGYAAPYARYVEEGTRPHWAPIAPLKLWARRVLGDEGAAYAVQRKIAQEGTDPQPFVGRGIDAMVAHLRTTGIGAFIDSALGER